jgi:glycosyltransferase involved in cell wall biosynthesis
MVNMFHQMRWQIALLNWLVRHRQQYAIIHACDFDTVLAALCCKLLMGKQVVYDIFDFYADMLRATPKPVKTMIRFLDLHAINTVDALILADDARYTQISGAHLKRSVVIYNALPDLPVRREPVADSNTREAGLRLAYFGNLQVERGLVELLDVLGGHPEWQLDLGGFGGDEALIQDKASALANVTWHGRLPYERVLTLTARADALIATYDPHIPNNRYASPNKLFEAMLLGKPILVAQGTNMDRIVQDADCGIVVQYGSRADLESALKTLHEQPELRMQWGAHARQAFETTYNWQAMQARLFQLYASLPQTS